MAIRPCFVKNFEQAPRRGSVAKFGFGKDPPARSEKLTPQREKLSPRKEKRYVKWEIFFVT